MAEEDEIDILGDCSLDSILSRSETLFNSSELLKCDDTPLVSQNSDLLKCDYTIHPQWLLDKPSTNPACWYSSISESEVSSATDIPSQTDIPQISSENSITDESGWTEKEKNLLYRGIEIFGKSNARLSQFIGSKNPAEVKYYLKNFYSDFQSASSNEIVFDNYIQETVVLSEDVEPAVKRDILEDAEIPASIEEVIAAVSTAKPTIIINTTKNEPTGAKVNYNDIPSGHSLLKKSFSKQQIGKTQIHSQKQRNKPTNKKIILKNKNVKFKFKTKVKVLKDRNEKIISPPKARRKHNKSQKHSDGDLKTSEVEIVTGQGLSVPVCSGEEVIKITKENDISDSDIEIDITDSDNETQQPNKVENNDLSLNSVETNPQDIIDSTISTYKEIKTHENDDCQKVVTDQKKIPDLTELNDEDVNFLKSTDLPEREYHIDMDKITDLEKFIHNEFFEGRPTKTPMRYIKVLNSFV